MPSTHSSRRTSLVPRPRLEHSGARFRGDEDAEITDGGRTIVFRLKEGIFFAQDPAFKGKSRELVAEDYVYSWKRMLDPNLAAPWNLLLNGKLVGADAVVARAKTAGKFDYDARIEGLLALDRSAAARALLERFGYKVAFAWNVERKVERLRLSVGRVEAGAVRIVDAFAELA